MKGKNRKTLRTRNKPARDAFRRRVAREQKARPDEAQAAVRFFVAEAIQANEPEKGGA